MTNMRIIDVQVFQIKPRWMLVKISTDEGITGWGEPTLEGKATVVEQAVKVFAELLINEDPMRIEHLYNKMYRGGFYRGGGVICSAISGIEQALWDIKGKKLGVPVWQLLGGKCRDRIRMYAHTVPFNDNPTREEILYWVNKRKKDGFNALKTSMVAPPIRHIDTWDKVESIIDRIAAMREAAGNDVDIAVDFHGRISPAMAPLLMKELEPYHPMFIEEPVLPENVEVMKRISEKTVLPVAAGERLFTTYGFREIIEKQAVNVVQPDLCHCGGILQAFKIAAMAANYYISVAPHNPLGPVALAACLQLDTCISNFTAQEHPTHEKKLDLGVGLFKDPFVIKEGYIDVPNKPGLGFEIDEDAVKELSYDGKWTNPILYFEDDHSMGEW
jgi:galactonate dehydratase